jgi:hypothetical protein
MSKPDAPTPPNPYATAAAQTGTNVSTAVANSFLNNTNQVTPTGNLNYDVTGNYSWTDPSTGSTYNIPRFTATQQLTDQGRAIQNQNLGAQYNLAGMANAQSGRISGLLSNELDLSGAPGAGSASSITNVPGAQTSYDAGGNIQGSLGGYGQQQSTFGDTQQGPQYGFGDAGDITRSYGPTDNFSADRQRVEDSLMSRMQPQLTRDRSAIEQRLADQGIRYGSQAYASAMDDYNRQSNDARFGAISQAGTEQARMMDMAAQRAGFQNAAQQQAYTQAQGRGQFANQAQQQDFGQQQTRGQFANDAQQQNYAQALGAGSFANAAQQQQNAQNASQAGFYNAGVGQQLAQAQSGFNAQNAARSQYLQEQYAQRNQPINEISALLGQTQVQNPSLTSTPGSQIATTDIGGLINQNFAQQSQNYQSANQNWQSTMGGLLGLGGKLGAAAIMSDRRVKENVKRMGTVFTADIDHDEPGRKLASFDVDHDEPRVKLPIYEYSYKNDPASIRHVGPMAQDVEQYDKKAVKSIGGVKHIDVNRVMGGILRAA